MPHTRPADYSAGLVVFIAIAIDVWLTLYFGTSQTYQNEDAYKYKIKYKQQLREERQSNTIIYLMKYNFTLGALANV